LKLCQNNPHPPLVRGTINRMLGKILKILLTVLWMGFIFILSGRPGGSFIIQTTNYNQILVHIFLYGVLSLLILIAARSWLEDEIYCLQDWKAYLAIILFSFLYGITDEIHQSFVSGREASIIDLFYDLLGAATGVLAYLFYQKQKKPKLLLHVCCIGCGAYVAMLLKKEFWVTLFFYNPNIYPEKEYLIRLKEAEKIAKKIGLPIITAAYKHQDWLESVQGHEKDHEGGDRCKICFKERLNTVAKYAKEKKYKYFSTTLTISPHKNYKEISKIGNMLAKKYGLKYLDRDFKKKDGYKKAVKISHQFKLYRQNYCGCEFSMRK